MNHLTPDELIDAVEGTLGPDRQKHLGACEPCRDEAARLTQILLAARGAEIPEPSPLFWDRFSARVRAAVADQDAPTGGVALRWLRWPVLVPLAGLALLVIALISSVSRVPVAREAEMTAAPSAGDRTGNGEPAWAVVSQLVGPVDIERAHEAGIIVEPGDAERAALELNAAEQQELIRLMKEEIEKAGG